jgi:hypothetical protein
MQPLKRYSMPYKRPLIYAVLGGAVGLIIVFLGSIILLSVTDVKIEWIVGLTIPTMTGLLVWYVKFSDHIKQEEMDLIYHEIGKKADANEINLRVDNIQRDVNDHKYNDKANYDRLYEMTVSIQKQLVEVYKILSK